MDILDQVLLERSCELCGDSYAVPARLARDSQAMLCECCPVDNDRECPQLQYAALVPPDLLDELTRLWSRIEEAARERGCSVVLVPPAEPIAQPAIGPRVELYRHAKIEALRAARSESSIANAGHYDIDTYPP
jgi:hypothetical protein